MCDLLPYLREYDRQWINIPRHQMKTTKPRVLVSAMNTYVARFLTKPDQVQKVIDALPQSVDNTAEQQADDKRSRTLSDNLSQNNEESKDVEVPWTNQQSTITCDQAEIAQKKVTKGSKAGVNKSPDDPEY